MGLSARSVLITGANRGLGLEFVKQMVKLPSPPKYLFATCRDPTSAKELQEVASSHPSVKVLKLEVTDSSDIERLYESVAQELGTEGLNLLINNAGANTSVTLETVNGDVMMNIFQINTVAPLMLTKKFLPLLKQAAKASGGNDMSCNRAAVVNISSIMGCITKASGNAYAYRCSKSAMNMWTKAMAGDVASDQVLVMSFHPGWVQTDMGGPRGAITPPDSVANMLSVMAKFGNQDSGTFKNYNGEPLPW